MLTRSPRRLGHTGCPRLAALNLDRNQILSEGAIALAEALRSNGSLTDLKIHDNGLSGEATPALANMLSVNAALRELNIGGNKLGKEGGALLAEALEANTTLSKFTALGTKFAPKDLERFKKLNGPRRNGSAMPLEIKINGR